MNPRAPHKPQQQKSIPWLPIFLLLATIYLFWILPVQLGDKPVLVEFSK